MSKRSATPAAFGVHRDAGRGQRLDVAQHGAGGHLELAGQRGSGQPTALAQQQNQRYQPVGAHYGVLASRLGAARVAPITTMLGVTRLAIPGQMVELEGTAVA